MCLRCAPGPAKSRLKISRTTTTAVVPALSRHRNHSPLWIRKVTKQLSCNDRSRGMGPGSLCAIAHLGRDDERRFLKFEPNSRPSLRGALATKQSMPQQAEKWIASLTLAMTVQRASEDRSRQH